MKATVHKMGNVQVVDLEGHLDFESANHLREVIGKFKDHRTIMNFERLSFVGSSGIKAFIEELRDISSEENGPLCCNLRSEFQKMFRLTGGQVPLYDSLDSAMDSLYEEEANVRPRRKLLSFDS